MGKKEKAKQKIESLQLKLDKIKSQYNEKYVDEKNEQAIEQAKQHEIKITQLAEVYVANGGVVPDFPEGTTPENKIQKLNELIAEQSLIFTGDDNLDDIDAELTDLQNELNGA